MDERAAHSKVESEALHTRAGDQALQRWTGAVRYGPWNVRAWVVGVGIDGSPRTNALMANRAPRFCKMSTVIRALSNPWDRAKLLHHGVRDVRTQMGP